MAIKLHSNLESQFHVSRETWDRLKNYANLVRKWQKTINLIAPSTVDQIWERHLLDGLQVFDHDPEPKTWVDLGSGAGFPGIVTAICLAELGHGWVHLIESNQKKAAFLRTAILETGARATVHPIRVEQAISLIPEIDRISARALASLDDLFDLSFSWYEQNRNCCAWFHKGRDYEAEIDLAHRRWTFDLVKYDSKIQDGSVMLSISNLQRKN